MFNLDAVGRVNRDRVGMYGPEELLVVGFGAVKWRQRGWNVFESPGRPGIFYRVADAAGNPPLTPIPMTVADLEGVEVIDGDPDEVLYRGAT